LPRPPPSQLRLIVCVHRNSSRMFQIRAQRKPAKLAEANSLEG
jgi:hypothetical protein